MRAAAVALGVLALAGCAPEPGLRVAIRGAPGLEVGPAGAVDALEVRLVASQSEDPSDAYTCQVSSRRFPEDDEELTLPVHVVVRPGDLPWRSLGLAVEGLRDGSPVIRAEAFVVTELSGLDEATLWLYPACLDGAGTAPCPAGEVCVATGGEPRCDPSRTARLFEDQGVVPSPCDAEP